MECIIKKQRLEVECLHQKNAWRYTDEVKQMLEITMMPLLEKKLQQFNFKGKTFYLDRVDIQLGTVDPSNLNALVQRFEEQVDKELMAQLAILGNQKETTQSKSKKNLQKSSEDTIIYYLEQGYLPWWSDFQKEKGMVDAFLLEWVDQNSTYRSQLLRNWEKWAPRIASTCKEATLIRLSSELFHEGALLVAYLKHLYTLIPSGRTSSQTKRIVQVQLWGKALVELHKKTPVPHIAVSLLEMAYTVLTPKTLSTFKKLFFNNKVANFKEWDTLLPIVWENFEGSIQKNRTTKSVQKGKTKQHAALEHVAEDEAAVPTTKADQASNTTADVESKEQLHQTIADSEPVEDTIIYYLEQGYLPWWSDFQKEKGMVDAFLLEWVDQNSTYRSQLLRNWEKWAPRIASTCKEATLIRLSSELFHEGALLVAYLKHLYTLIPSGRTSSQTKRIVQVQLWGKALVELHKKTPVPHIAVSLLEMAYTVLTPKTLSTFKKLFFNNKVANFKEWDTLLPIVWENFEGSIQKNRTTKSVQKGKTKQHAALEHVAEDEAAQQISATREKSVDACQQETGAPISAKNATIQGIEEGSSNSTDVTSPTTKILPVRQPIPSNTRQFWQEVWNKRVAALREKAKKSLPEPIPVQPKEPRKVLPTGIPTEETQEIYIHNAGMVICASYIPKLFQVLAWVKDNTFIDELSVQKALLLGHYLVTGEVEAVEHQLPLVKLLCGLPISTPFVTGISLSKEEQARADELLRALIKHWPKIGSIRIQSFRNSFLKREGKLSNQGQQWTLQVEQRPFDMVLQTLPWNIRMIKTSLMHELLLVEWPY